MKCAMTCEPDLTGTLHLYKARLLNLWEHQNCAFPGYYVASSGNYLPMFWDNPLVPSSRVLPS
jgi:hypothetical protein